MDSIWYYTYKNWSENQANRYVNLIIDKIEFLSQNQFSGKSIHNIRSHYRVSKVKSHLIFYIVLNEKKIKIIRILHQSMDIENRLKE